MSLLMLNILLVLIGAPLVMTVTALPALIQWPVPASSPTRRAAFFGLRPAGGGWR